MSPATLQLYTGFRDRIIELGERVLHQASSVEFLAILSPLPPINPVGALLGDDSREAATMEARRDQCPAIRKNDLIEQVRPPWRTAAIADQFPNPVWRVVRRDNNTIAYAVKYWLVKVGDDDTTS